MVGFQQQRTNISVYRQWGRHHSVLEQLWISVWNCTTLWCIGFVRWACKTFCAAMQLSNYYDNKLCCTFIAGMLSAGDLSINQSLKTHFYSAICLLHVCECHLIIEHHSWMFLYILTHATIVQTNYGCWCTSYLHWHEVSWLVLSYFMLFVVSDMLLIAFHY